MGRREREVYLGRSVLVRGMLCIGYDFHRQADELQLAAHSHGDAFELCYLAGGSVEWWVEREVHEVKAGQVYLTRPRERHGGVDAVMHPCRLYWLQLRFPRRAALPGLTTKATRDMERRLLSIRQRCFDVTPSVGDAFARLHDAHRRHDDLSAVRATAALYDVLVGTLDGHDRHATRTSPVIEKAMRWMADRLDEPFAVEDVAAVTGLSVPHFHDRFRAETGLTPGEWRTRQRLRLARQLLRDPKRSITDVALSCGFSTSQYFATVFRRYVGLTPRAYRAKLRAG